MIKKIICVLIIAVSILSLTSCNDATKENEIVTIHWYMKKSVDNVSGQEAVEAEVNKILEKEVGARIKMHMIDPSAWEQKMNVMISSGEEFDICMTTATSNSFPINVRRDAFLDIKDLLNQYGQDILAKVDKRALDVATVGGKVLAIPGQGPYSTPSVFVLNKKFVDKYNFDYKSVKTLKDMEPLFEKIVKNDPGIVPIYYVNDEVNQKYTDDSIPGLRFSEETKKYEIELLLPEWADKYKMLNEYYQKGYIAKDATSKKDGIAEMKSGKYALLSETGAYSEDGSKSSSFYGFPCVEALNGYRTITTRELINQGNAISATSKHPEKAIQVLNQIWKDPYLSNTLAYGIEGINYTVDETKEYRSVIPKSGKDQTWGIWHNWVGPLWDQWDSPWNRTEKLEEMRQMNEVAGVSSSLGFLFDVEPVKNEVAQITAVITETNSILKTGSMPNFDDYYNKSLEKLKNAGIEKVQAEANKQLEEWKTKNKK